MSGYHSGPSLRQAKVMTEILPVSAKQLNLQCSWTSSVRALIQTFLLQLCVGGLGLPLDWSTENVNQSNPSQGKEFRIIEKEQKKNQENKDEFKRTGLSSQVEVFPVMVIPRNQATQLFKIFWNFCCCEQKNISVGMNITSVVFPVYSCVARSRYIPRLLLIYFESPETIPITSSNQQKRVFCLWSSAVVERFEGYDGTGGVTFQVSRKRMVALPGSLNFCDVRPRSRIPTPHEFEAPLLREEIAVFLKLFPS